MPIIKSAKKRVRIASKATARNSRTKRSLKSSAKSFATKPSDTSLRKAQSALDTAVKKGLMHKNKAARKKQQLAATAKDAGVKVSAKKAIPKKSTDKKLATKPAAKKSPVKKTAKK